MVISVVDSDGRRLYRRRGSEAFSEVDVSCAPLASVFATERTNVVEMISPVDGVKRVYGTFSVSLPRWVEDVAAEEPEEDADVKALVGS